MRLTVPNGWVVGATGTERGRRDEGDRTTTHHYYAEDVHDFAWTTSPDYVERIERFGHEGLPPVSMRLLLQPEHVRQAERHFNATRATLRYYGEWFGPYPYANITIVDPAWQSGADGMEYPMLFTAGTRWLAPRTVAEPEDVTVHEAGHQFWYGMVATNEFEHAWMDEGINTFATARALEQFFGPQYYAKRYFGGYVPWVFDDLPLSRATDGSYLSSYRNAADADAQSTPTWRYWPGTAGVITYFKTALWLNTLERMLGWDTLQRILSTYFTALLVQASRAEGLLRRRQRGQRPRPDVVLRSGLPQLERLRLRRRRVHERAGGGPRLLRRLGQADVLGHRRQQYVRTGDVYRTTLVVRRHGDGIFPVNVRIVFENGQEQRWQWDGRERWKQFEVDRPVRAVSAEVDPERVLLLDVNYTNNTRSLAPKANAAARKWSLTWLIWLQDHLLTYGFFI